jgi:hypothetical protein
MGFPALAGNMRMSGRKVRMLMRYGSGLGRQIDGVGISHLESFINGGDPKDSVLPRFLQCH